MAVETMLKDEKSEFYIGKTDYEDIWCFNQSLARDIFYIFFDQNVQFTYGQATGEASSPKKGTSST